jgi:hypothetical protein
VVVIRGDLEENVGPFVRESPVAAWVAAIGDSGKLECEFGEKSTDIRLIEGGKRWLSDKTVEYSV